MKRKVQQTSDVATRKNIWLTKELFREIPTGQVDKHHDQVKANIPELGGMVFTSLKEMIQFDSLVAAFR